jgi:hypothetical protein
MSQSLPDLVQFIKDFGLRDPNAVTFFNARIEFIINEDVNTKESEVHIITSDHLACIYFLSPLISAENLPEMLDIKEYKFNYVKQSHLKIEGNDYVILLFPLTQP